MALFIAIPGPVIWSYAVAGWVFAIGLTRVSLRGDWRQSRGLNKLILLGPLFYAAPLAAFGVEHFTSTTAIASIVPSWMPWHLFWAYFVGACFIAAPLSIATGIQERLSASLLALTFFLFVLLMDAPAWLQNPGDRIALTLMLRELSFSGGALALAARLGQQRSERGSRISAIIARYFIASAVVFYSFEQFRHTDRVPGVPLERVTPVWIPAHVVCTYLAATIYAVGGVLLLIGKRTRSAATWVSLAVLLVELVVYIPIGFADRASLGNGLNYVMDTLMFCGAVLLLAGTMSPENSLRDVRGDHKDPSSSSLR